MSKNENRPVLGQLMTVHGIKCRIERIYRFGTVDVVSIDGRYAWRVTGLPFL